MQRGNHLSTALQTTLTASLSPDELKIVLTGKHIPATLQRDALWSAQSHRIPTGWRHLTALNA